MYTYINLCTHSFSLSLCRSHSLTFTHTYTHTFSLAFVHSRSFSLSLSLSLCLSSLSLSLFLSVSIYLSFSFCLSLSLSLSITHTHTHTHTHAHDTHGAAWVQVLCKVGGMPLIMCVRDNGCSCLYIAAEQGHTAVVEVGAGGGRQRETGGRVSAATAHGTLCRGCRQ